jgi:hypothetical protein
VRDDLVAERAGQEPALGEHVLDALAQDADRVAEGAAFGAGEAGGEGVLEDRGDVVAEAQEQGVVAEQLEGALEGPTLGRGLHQGVRAGQVVVEDLADRTDLVAEVLDDLAVHRRHRFLDTLEVARQLPDQIGDVRVAVAHPVGVDHGGLVAGGQAVALGLELRDLGVQAADLHRGVRFGAGGPPVHGVDDHRQAALADEGTVGGQGVDEAQGLERVRRQRVLLVAVGGVRADEPLGRDPLAAEGAAVRAVLVGRAVRVLCLGRCLGCWLFARWHPCARGLEAGDVFLDLQVHPVSGDVLHVAVEHRAEDGEHDTARGAGHQPERRTVEHGTDACVLEVDVGHAAPGGRSGRGRWCPGMQRARRGCVGLSWCSSGPGWARGRYQTRTDDLFGVNEARYQLRQSPLALACGSIVADARRCAEPRVALARVALCGLVRAAPPAPGPPGASSTTPCSVTSSHGVVSSARTERPSTVRGPRSA